MYKVAALLILGLALAPFARCQDDDQPANPEMQRQEIVNLENEAARAIQTNTGTFFRRVYSDDFSGTLSHGQPVNKIRFIAAVQAGDVKYDSFTASDINVRFYQDMAIATCLWSASGTFKGQHFDSGIRAMHVYVNTPRGWRVVAGQLTILPASGQLPL
jgi:Domain of unknown function (DUF4440)